MRRPISEGIDVWSIRLDQPSHPLTMGWLEPDELARAARFRRPLDRDRFLARRIALRLVLAGYGRIHPREVQLVEQPGGRPVAVGPGLPRFSTSHSDGLAVVAISDLVAVGVDVEAVRAHDDWPAVADRFFSAAERVELQARPAGGRPSGFLRGGSPAPARPPAGRPCSPQRSAALKKRSATAGQSS